jgi:hypothetical protein
MAFVRMSEDDQDDQDGSALPNRSAEPSNGTRVFQMVIL